MACRNYRLIFALIIGLGSAFGLQREAGATDRLSGDEGLALPEVEDWLLARGVTAAASPDSQAKLRLVLDEQAAEFTHATKKKKKARRALAFVGYARERLCPDEDLAGDDRDVRLSCEARYLLAQRALFAALTLTTSAEGEARAAVQWQKLSRFLFGSTPRLPSLTLRAATTERPKTLSGEARFLTGEGQGRQFFEPSATAPTYGELARLDVHPDHPAWHRQEALQGSPWAALEQWVETAMTERVLKPQDLGHRYRLERARRVLFFDEVDEGGTSAKVQAKDAYGAEWQIKWGEEVETEPVVNRLYLEAGGKFTDLVYANGVGPRELVLVLPRQSAKKGKRCRPLNGAELARCLFKAPYRFNLAPYIYETGTITQTNVDKVLAALDPRLRAARAGKLIGRSYVAFRESSVEFRPPTALAWRGGAAAFSQLGARQDRVARGLALLNLWLGNRDAKDSNNRALILRGDPAGQGARGDRYIEYQHDLGTSLGGFLTTGDLNQFAVGDDFATRLDGQTAAFYQRVLWWPGAWRDARDADLRWMARRIGQVEPAAISEAVAATRWPRFMQEVLFYRLRSRQAQIAELYGVPLAGEKVGLTPPTITVALGSAAARQQVIATMVLDNLGQSPDAARITAELAAEFERLAAQVGVAADHADVLAHDGQLTPCERTLLVGFLQDHLYPTGLVRRVSRLTDHLSAEARRCPPEL